MIHDRSLNGKHDCNDVIINSINVNCASNMQNLKLGDACIVMSTTYCNDHDWGGNVSYDIEKKLRLMMNMLLIIMFARILKVGLEMS